MHTMQYKFLFHVQMFHLFFCVRHANVLDFLFLLVLCVSVCVCNRTSLKALKKDVKNRLLEKRKLKDSAIARRAARRANALQRRAQRTLTFIKNGIINALWTALAVACVKLTPLLLFAAKLLFQSAIPLASMALNQNRRGHFADADDDDKHYQTDTEDEDDDEEHEEYNTHNKDASGY